MTVSSDLPHLLRHVPRVSGGRARLADREESEDTSVISYGD